MMRQAGRYLPEYRALREKVSFLELCRTPELAAEVTVQPIDRFDLDAAILFSDILVVFDAMDVEVDFQPGPVVARPVRTAEDAEHLRWGDPVAELPYVMNGVRACKEALAGRVPLIGFAGAPFTILSYLVEGKGSRDFENVKGLLFRDPALFAQLMANLTKLLGDYLLGQVEAGVDAVQIFDSWAGALSPRDYREHVAPHVHRLVERLQPADVPVIFFARGNANHLEVVREVPADVLGIDWTIGLDRAIQIVGPERVVQGNLDPMLLLGDPERLEARAREVVEQGRGTKAHIFNLGHGISRYTDPEMARRMIDAVHGA